LKGGEAPSVRRRRHGEEGTLGFTAWWTEYGAKITTGRRCSQRPVLLLNG
jgi:hypothetical protein